jgi:hypothetical protein
MFMVISDLEALPVSTLERSGSFFNHALESITHDLGNPNGGPAGTAFNLRPLIH